MQKISYTYNGHIGQEHRKFNFKSARMLRSVFSSNDWNNIASTSYPLIEPAQIGNSVGGYEVEIDYRHGNLTLRGGYYYQNPVRNGCHGFVVIFLSGRNRPTMRNSEAIIKGYLSDPFNKYVKGVLCVDYRGFGLSRPVDHWKQTDWTPSGNYLPTSKGLYADVAAMIDFVTNTQQVNVTRNKVLLHGYSLGSGPATENAKQNDDLGGLVLHGPIRSVQYHAEQLLAAQMQGRLIQRPLAKLGAKIAGAHVGFRNALKIKDINIPICITCGPNDGVWPQAQELKRNCEEYKKYYHWAVHGGDHFDTAAPFLVMGEGQYNPVDPFEKFLQYVAS